MMEETSTPSRSLVLRHPLRLVLAGLGLGILFDVLFNGKMLGVNAPAFTLMVLASLTVVLGWERVRPLVTNLWLPAVLLFFAGMVAVRDNGLLTFLNVCACLGLLALIAVYQVQKPTGPIGLVEIVLAPLRAVVGSLGHAGQAARRGLRPLGGARGEARRKAMPVLRGLLLAIPVLFIFGALLASADLIFAERIRQVLGPELLRTVGRWTGHLVVAVAAGFVLAGGLAYAVRQRRDDWVDDVSSVRTPHLSGVTEVSIMISSVNLLFFLFVLIQIPYLFGGQVNVVPGKFTYAEYARRGFGELVAVAVLVFGLLVVMRGLAPHDNRRQTLAFKVPATFLVGLTCVLLASAFKRLLLYEQAYGFTQMRIYPHVFMVWLAALLAWLAVCLWLRRDLLAIGVLVAALGFAGTLDLLNPDAFVVRENLQMALSQQAEPDPRERFVDAVYFEELSADAVPELLIAAEQLTDRRGQEIESGLRRRFEAMQRGTRWRQWPSLHLARNRAYRLLVERFDGDN
ncbi:MAG TPA: DUF4173 domain-containing protein [Anaerolineae bacterium]|nr:DUF4173 domain-containing protein [Anaerolineae bacterium]